MMPCWTALSWLGAGRSSNSATRSNIYFNKLTCPGCTWTSTTRRQTWNRTSNLAFAQLHMRVTAKNKGIARLSNQSQCLVGLEGPSSSSTLWFESCTHFLICGFCVLFQCSSMFCWQWAQIFAALCKHSAMPGRFKAESLWVLAGCLQPLDSSNHEWTVYCCFVVQRLLGGTLQFISDDHSS